MANNQKWDASPFWTCQKLCFQTKKNQSLEYQNSRFKYFLLQSYTFMGEKKKPNPQQTIFCVKLSNISSRIGTSECLEPAKGRWEDLSHMATALSASWAQQIDQKTRFLSRGDLQSQFSPTLPFAAEIQKILIVLCHYFSDTRHMCWVISEGYLCTEFLPTRNFCRKWKFREFTQAQFKCTHFLFQNSAQIWKEKQIKSEICHT